MIRSFGQQTLNGNAQPLFGDKITAAFNGKVDNSGLLSLAVADSSIYKNGDRWILGWASGSATNCILVDHIVDATHVAFVSEGNAAISAWANNTQLALDIACMGLVIEAIDGNAGAIWLGADSTVTNVGGGSAFRKIQKVAAAAIPDHFDLYDQMGQDPLRTTDITMAGTNADKVLIGAVIR